MPCNEKRPAFDLKNHLRCACGGNLYRVAGTYRRKDTLYLKCGICGKRIAILDDDLLTEVARQIAKHDPPAERHYSPSGKVVRLANAVNRGLEHPDKPEDIVSLILQGISARYDCCPAPTESEPDCRPAEVNFTHFDQAVSHITITDENTINVHFI